MVIPNVNPHVVDEEETVETYFQRSMDYLKTGNLPEMLTGLDVYKNHFLPRIMIPAIQSFCGDWLAAIKIGLFRDMPLGHRLLVFDVLIHNVSNEDALPIVVEFLKNLSPEECTEVRKQLQDMPELASL